MNNTVERYIYDVTRRLAEKERAEVKRELEANINDMLADNPSEQEVIDVLTKLGEPRVLAEQYRQKPRYLISPSMFELYISVLKKAVLIAACVCACIGMFASVFSDSITEIIKATVNSAFYGAFMAAFWVTIGFSLADYYGTKQKPWTINDLPNLSSQEGIKISRSSSIAAMTLSVLFTSLIIITIVFDKQIFIIAQNSEIINPFSQTALNRCVPYIACLGALSFSVNALKLYWARWNIPVCAANIIYDILWVIAVIYISNWPDLFSDKFIAFKTEFAGKFGTDFNIWPGGFIKFFIAVNIAVAIFDIGYAVWNTRKSIHMSSL